MTSCITIGQSYPRAPIVEATLDLRVQSREDTGSDDDEFELLASLYSGDAEFEDPTPLYTFSSNLTVDAGDTVIGRMPGRQIGYTFKKADETALIRANIDRYAYSRLGLYTDWSEFLKDAEQYWNRYRNLIDPAMVSAVGVRFVNRIVVPKPAIEIKDYLRTSVDVSPYLPQMIAGYFVQVGVPLEEYRAEAVITTALGDSDQDEEDSSTSLILDIDVRSSEELDVAAGDFDQSLLGVLSRLRDAKNFVFEACITDATRGLIS